MKTTTLGALAAAARLYDRSAAVDNRLLPLRYRIAQDAVARDPRTAKLTWEQARDLEVV